MDDHSDLDGRVLLLGITGVTGRCALEGLIAGGLAPSQLLAVSRNPSGGAAQRVADRGVEVVGGDLDDPSSIQPLLSACSRVYCHALSGDAATADPLELRRGRELARLAAAAGTRHVVYNGSAGRGANSGVSQMAQKHAVEDALLASGVGATCLETTMFMEEFWKRYTRPQLLKGSFPFSVPADKPLQLVSARDLGLAAAVCLRNRAGFAGRCIPLAADALTPVQMAAAFGAAQGGAAVRHVRPPGWLFWFFNRDLYRIVRFLSTTGYEADVSACRAAFPGMLSFAEFLEATRWGDAERTYDQGVRFDGPMPPPVAAGAVEAGAAGALGGGVAPPVARA